MPSLPLILFVFGVSLLAAFLQVHIGIGFGIIGMIFFPMLFPVPQAVALNLTIATASAAYLTYKYWKFIRWKAIAPVIAIAVVFSVFATIFSLGVKDGTLKIILGCVLVLLSIYFTAFADKVKIRPSLRNSVICGAATGVGNGLFGVGGPPVALYLMASIGEKMPFLASLQIFFLILNIATLTTRAFTGAYTWEIVKLVPIGWAAVAVGTWFGVRTLDKVPEHVMKRMVYICIGIAGLLTIIQSL